MRNMRLLSSPLAHVEPVAVELGCVPRGTCGWLSVAAFHVERSVRTRPCSTWNLWLLRLALFHVELVAAGFGPVPRGTRRIWTPPWPTWNLWLPSSALFHVERAASGLGRVPRGTCGCRARPCSTWNVRRMDSTVFHVERAAPGLNRVSRGTRGHEARAGFPRSAQARLPRCAWRCTRAGPAPCSTWNPRPSGGPRGPETSPAQGPRHPRSNPSGQQGSRPKMPLDWLVIWWLNAARAFVHPATLPARRRRPENIAACNAAPRTPGSE
jgi:hypothetical protein